MDNFVLLLPTEILSANIGCVEPYQSSHQLPEQGYKARLVSTSRIARAGAWNDTEFQQRGDDTGRNRLMKRDGNIQDDTGVPKEMGFYKIRKATQQIHESKS